jgi:hypothetical protein
MNGLKLIAIGLALVPMMCDSAYASEGSLNVMIPECYEGRVSSWSFVNFENGSRFLYYNGRLDKGCALKKLGKLVNEGRLWSVNMKSEQDGAVCEGILQALETHYNNDRELKDCEFTNLYVELGLIDRSDYRYWCIQYPTVVRKTFDLKGYAMEKSKMVNDADEAIKGIILNNAWRLRDKGDVVSTYEFMNDEGSLSTLVSGQTYYMGHEVKKLVCDMKDKVVAKVNAIKNTYR